MSNLKRYKYTANVGGCETWYTMDENINGEYVKFEDIKHILPTGAQQPQGAIPPEQTAPSAAPVVGNK